MTLRVLNMNIRTAVSKDSGELVKFVDELIHLKGTNEDAKETVQSEL